MSAEVTPRFPGPRWLLAELTYTCPLQCPYCSNPVDFYRYRNELDTDGWVKVLKQARELGAVQLGLSGGEPLVRRDLEEIVQEGRELGYYTNLITSGIGMDAARVKKLRDAGMDHIQISFQASDQVLNDRFAGTDAFKHKVAMAREVKAQGYPMVLNFVLYRDNIDRLSDILDLAMDLKADQVELANTQYYGWALTNQKQLLPSRDQLQRAEKVAQDYQKRYEGKSKIIFVVPDYYEDRPKACMAGWGNIFLSIAPDGMALPCQGARQLPGLDFPNVRDHDIEWIWYESDAFNQYRGDSWMKEPCRTCPERGKDFGGCRCQAFQMTGDATNADPVCGLSPHHSKIVQAVEAANTNDVLENIPLVFRNSKNSRKHISGEQSL